MIMNTYKVKFYIICAFTILTSILSFIYFYQTNLHLMYGDAQSRLNISRKIIDNLTPGLAQLGDIWLPLPQFLMLTTIWSKYLWHTGISGYIMSGSAFIFTVILLYKLGLLLFRRPMAGLVMALFALTNINMLYIQTTAMSESFFIFTITGTIYYFAKWALDTKIRYLIYCALFISAATLTRYEGFFLLPICSVLVAVFIFYKTHNYSKTEGYTVLFTTLAGFGLAIWLGYSWVIFGDPLYWAKIYKGEKSIISTDIPPIKVITDEGATIEQKGRLSDALYDYYKSLLHMNGLITGIFATFAIIIFLIYFMLSEKDNRKSLILALMILSIAPFLFIVYTIFKGNIPLSVPPITLASLLTKDTNFRSEYNIRYGLAMIPLIALSLATIGYVNKKFYYYSILIIFLQLYTTFYTPYYTIYSLPNKLARSDVPGTNKASQWLKENYDGGLILISALKHDPVMFYLNIDYKNFIHEGAGDYWLESRSNPQKYATWIFMVNVKSDSQLSDSVTKYLLENNKLNQYYNIVYDEGPYIIYKIKDPSILDPSVQNLARK